MALRVVERVEEPSHPTSARLRALLGEVAEMTSDALAGVDDESSEVGLVDQLALIERLRGAVAAAQAAVLVRFGRTRVDRQLAEDVHPRDVGSGVVEEIGLACRVSPTVAARRLSSARAWWFDLPRVYADLSTGRLSEQTADAVVAETRHLDAATRRQVDARLAKADLASKGLGEAAALARRYAYEADRAAYVARGRQERGHRWVGLRPAPDTMSVLSGYLSVEQGVACLAALRRHTDGVVAGGRTRDQIMADTLVERLTGQATATDVAVEIQLIVPAELAADPGSARTATVAGGGPLPGALARELIDQSRGARHIRRPAHHARRTAVRDRPAAALHREPGRPGRRPGPDLPRALLRRSGAAPRPRPASRRRRADHPDQRPWAVCPPQPRSGTARLARGRRPRRPGSSAAHRADHDADRSRLHRSGARPALSLTPRGCGGRWFPWLDRRRIRARSHHRCGRHAGQQAGRPSGRRHHVGRAADRAAHVD